jgi:hypothetical protein
MAVFTPPPQQQQRSVPVICQVFVLYLVQICLSRTFINIIEVGYLWQYLLITCVVLISTDLLLRTWFSKPCWKYMILNFWVLKIYTIYSSFFAFDSFGIEFNLRGLSWNFYQWLVTSILSAPWVWGRKTFKYKSSNHIHCWNELWFGLELGGSDSFLVARVTLQWVMVVLHGETGCMGWGENAPPVFFPSNNSLLATELKQSK